MQIHCLNSHIAFDRSLCALQRDYPIVWSDRLLATATVTFTISLLIEKLPPKTYWTNIESSIEPTYVCTPESFTSQEKSLKFVVLTNNWRHQQRLSWSLYIEEITIQYKFNIYTWYKHKMQVAIQRKTKSYVELDIVNPTFLGKKRKLIALSLLNVIILLQLVFYQKLSFLGCLPLAFVGIFSAVIFNQLLNLKEKETLKAIGDVGIEKSTVFAFNRRNQVFIQHSKIIQVHINEVVDFVSIAQVLAQVWINLKKS